MTLVWHDGAWEDYVWWQAQDRKMLVRINRLLAEAQRDPSSGIGKPEALRRDLAGCWSRRITDEHRLVYRLTNRGLEILSCRYHYGE